MSNTSSNSHGVYLPRRRYTNANSSNVPLPLRIGIFGGSFNPIHLGHTLLAITTQQTKPIDQVVLVPVYKHAKKRDLLPFDDRVAMCQLSIQPFTGNSSNSNSNDTTNTEGNVIIVSTIEQHVGASNGVMIRGLKQLYPPDTQFLYICGDDFFRWMEKPIGIETINEVHGLIIQRRLHQQPKQQQQQQQHGEYETSTSSNQYDRYYKEPIDEQRIRGVAARLNLSIDFIYGELPHFSSTLVRTAPGHWKSFLSSSVVQYLEQRPHLLQQLISNLHTSVDNTNIIQQQQQPPSLSISNAQNQQQQNLLQKTDMVVSSNDDVDDGTAVIKTKDNQQLSTSTSYSQSADTTTNAAAEWIMQGLDMVHCLQLERGRSALWLSLGTNQSEQGLIHCQSLTDTVIDRIQKQQQKQSSSSSSSVQVHENEVNSSACINNNNNIYQHLPEVIGLIMELQQVPVWLHHDRTIVQNKCSTLKHDRAIGITGWMARAALVEKFNPRIDVLLYSALRAITEIRNQNYTTNPTGSKAIDETLMTTTTVRYDIMPELLWKWSVAKEALGRQRAFVCAGGPYVSKMITQSMEMRQRLIEYIYEKDRSIGRVMVSWNHSNDTNNNNNNTSSILLHNTVTGNGSGSSAVMMSTTSTPDALHRLLENVTRWEWKLMKSFAPSTPLPLVHKLLSYDNNNNSNNSNPSHTNGGQEELFDVDQFFNASTTAIDFLLTFTKVLAASACTAS
jgi:nicotinate (nicotinamide) nucleotide adenylyltransferase